MQKTLIVCCKGLSPLLVHPITENSARERIISVSEGKEPAELLLRGADGNILFPTLWLEQALYMSAVRSGYGPWMKKACGSLALVPDLTLLTDSSGGTPRWETYSHPRHLRRGSRRIGLIRCPQFNDWGFEAEIQFEDPPIAPTLLQRLFGVAGREAGIGLFSPACGGKNSFGRFQAVSWRWKDNPQTAVSLCDTAKILGTVRCGNAG